MKKSETAIREIACAALAALLFAFAAQGDDTVVTLKGTQPLTVEGDLSAAMRAGFDKFLSRELDESVAERAAFWKRDFSSAAAYNASVAANRERFRRMIGLVDERAPIKDLELLGTLGSPAKIAEDRFHVIYAVRWPVLEGVFGEGLLLEPKQGIQPVAHVVALPDADQTPEMLVGLIRGVDPKSQFAVRLAEGGCRVVIPALIDRRDTYSGNPRIAMTNQPHREWIYRQSYTMGRHVIGYEVHKVLALVDWLRPRLTEGLGRPTPLVLAGYGEGGLIAMYATAADTRIDGALVSGYFDSRQQVYDEPIYRNLFGLLREFGDAEIASLVYPRPLVIEYSEHPDVPGPPAAREGRRAVAAPGRIRTPEFGSVQAEVERAKKLLQNTSLKSHLPVLVAGQGGAPLPFGSRQAIDALCKRTGIELRSPKDADSGPTLTADAPLADADARQKRQVAELVEYNQRLLRLSPHVRASFWSKAKPASAETWAKDVQFYRDYFHDEIVGRFPPPSLPASPRSRRIFDKPKWQGYEVLLDVYPDVFAWGYLLVPKGIADGEKRPCVVCQHGLEGLPQDVLDEDADSAGYQTYRAYAARLAERGFVVFCPHNFYRGGNDFRQLQRKANPLKKTLFGLAVAQHTQITEWLAGLPFVDGERIGYYGLSYGGSTASRIPPLVPRYCLAINSANFNESVGKAVSVDYGFSYVFHGTYEWFEFGAGGTFSDGDMAALVAPRPYMVERGHDDGVSTDEWVAGEFARVRRLYDALGVGERARIEFFSGGHVINGRGTFEFLHEQFGWPAPSE